MTLYLSSWTIISNMMLQSMGLVVPATFLSVARQGLFFIPLILILSYFFGLTGIQITQAIADLLTFLFAVPLQLRTLRKLPMDAPQQ